MRLASGGLCEIPLPSTRVCHAAGEESIHQVAPLWASSFHQQELGDAQSLQRRTLKGSSYVGSGTSLDGEPAPKQIRSPPPKELTDLLFVKSYTRSYLMQLFIELLDEKMRQTKAQTDSSHFKASLKHLRMCAFFFFV